MPLDTPAPLLRLSHGSRGQGSKGGRCGGGIVDVALLVVGLAPPVRKTTGVGESIFCFHRRGGGAWVLYLEAKALAVQAFQITAIIETHECL